MSDFITQLRLAEKAAEDIYFAKVDRALIASLHERIQAQKNAGQVDAATPRVSIEAAADDMTHQQILRKTGINS